MLKYKPLYDLQNKMYGDSGFKIFYGVVSVIMREKITKLPNPQINLNKFPCAIFIIKYLEDIEKMASF